MNDALAFRRRFLDAEPLFGTFIKTPSPHSIEIIAGVGFDFVIIDAEHGPFDRVAMDVCLLAARGSRIAALVRVPDTRPAPLLAALDDGASGVIAPHITTAQQARELVAACRYAGNRGFSNSPRAGGYGARGLWEHVDEADEEVTVIAMIEDPEAVENIADILAVDGLDGIFIGRGDLAVALDDRAADMPRVAKATQAVIQAARAANKPVSILAANAAEAQAFRTQGVSAFVSSSDQGFMRSGAMATLSGLWDACTLTER